MFKKHKDDGMDKVLEEVEFEKLFHSLPKFRPEDSVSTTPLPQSPRGIISVYKQKNKISSLAKPDGDGSDSKMVDHEAATPKTPKSSRLDDRKFFGENFSLDLANTAAGQSTKIFDFESDINSPRTPSSPGTFSNRRILDQRRTLVMQLFNEHGLYPSAPATMVFQKKHEDIFPNKGCLQLKIREVRQKMMASAQNTPKTPTTPSASSSIAASSAAAAAASSLLMNSMAAAAATSADNNLDATKLYATGSSKSSMSSSIPSSSSSSSSLLPLPSSLSVMGQGGQSSMGNPAMARRSSPLAKSPLAFNNNNQ